MGQRFYASPSDTFTSPNGAVGYRSGVSFDCLGPYAKVRNCPIYLGQDNTGIRLTCYATDYPDTWFSIPASTRYRGHYIKGYFTSDESVGGVIFRVMDSSKHHFQQ